MIHRRVSTFIDSFNRAQSFTTTPGMNGWTIKDTSSAGTPTYLCVTEDGGAAKLSFDSQSEEQVVTLYQNDVLIYDLAKIKSLYWIAKVADFSAVSTLVLGVGSAQNNTEDSVATNAWFRMQGSASQTALVVETDDGTNDNNDVATGDTLAAVYKKLEIDFTNGLSDVRFNINGAPVARGTTFDMSALTAGLNVQPFAQIHKASGATTDSVTLAEFGIQYEFAYGA